MRIVGARRSNIVVGVVGENEGRGEKGRDGQGGKRELGEMAILIGSLILAASTIHW